MDFELWCFAIMVSFLVTVFIGILTEKANIVLCAIGEIFIGIVFLIVAFLACNDYTYKAKQVVKVKTITANNETFQEITYRDDRLLGDDKGTLKSINLTLLNHEVYPEGTKAVVELSGTTRSLGVIFSKHLNVVVPYKEK